MDALISPEINALHILHGRTATFLFFLSGGVDATPLGRTKGLDLIDPLPTFWMLRCPRVTLLEDLSIIYGPVTACDGRCSRFTSAEAAVYSEEMSPYETSDMLP